MPYLVGETLLRLATLASRRRILIIATNTLCINSTACFHYFRDKKISCIELYCTICALLSPIPPQIKRLSSPSPSPSPSITTIFASSFDSSQPGHGAIDILPKCIRCRSCTSEPAPLCSCGPTKVAESPESGTVFSPPRLRTHN